MPGRQDGSHKEQRGKQTTFTENAFWDNQQSWGELNYNFETETKGYMKVGQWIRVLSVLGVEWRSVSSTFLEASFQSLL